MDKEHRISICICSGKGGTGKTTITTNLAMALVNRGLSVTVIDGDIEMANLSIYFGVDKQVQMTLHDVLSGLVPIEDATFIHPSGVKIVAGAIDLERIEGTEIGRIGEIIKDLATDSDVLIIDAPGDLLLSTIYMTFTQKVLFVTEKHRASITDCSKVIHKSRILKKDVIGVVINKVTNISKEEILDIREKLFSIPIVGVIEYVKHLPDMYVSEMKNSQPSIQINKLADRIQEIMMSGEKYDVLEQVDKGIDITGKMLDQLKKEAGV